MRRVFFYRQTDTQTDRHIFFTKKSLYRGNNMDMTHTHTHTHTRAWDRLVPTSMTLNEPKRLWRTWWWWWWWWWWWSFHDAAGWVNWINCHNRHKVSAAERQLFLFKHCTIHIEHGIKTAIANECELTARSGTCHLRPANGHKWKIRGVVSELYVSLGRPNRTAWPSASSGSEVCVGTLDLNWRCMNRVLLRPMILHQ